MSRESWISPTLRSRSTLTEKKSVFIAQVSPINSAKDADTLIQEARSEFPDARHHVYAWRLCGDEFLQRYSDDGEPSGTAGLPVLDVLRKNNIEDAAIVVTRYFGGTLLGTGGLVRAYQGSAFMALSASRPTRFVVGENYIVCVGYAHLDRLRHLLLKAGFSDSEPQFGAEATIVVFCPLGREEELQRLCMDATSGQIRIEHIGRTAMPTGKQEELCYEA